MKINSYFPLVSCPRFLCSSRLLQEDKKKVGPRVLSPPDASGLHRAYWQTILHV